MRQLQLGRFRCGDYSEDFIRNAWYENLATLVEHLPAVFKRYKVYRFPSGILPMWDQVPERLWRDDATVQSQFAVIGRLVVVNGVRATFHPGQFCSLSSDNWSVREASVRELNHHAWQFDQMMLPVSPYHAINVHGGKRGFSDVLIASINDTTSTSPYGPLSSSARERLTFENDECSYSTVDLLRIYRHTGVPVVFDSHHHTFNTGGISMVLASNAAKETWRDVKPLQHLSNSDPELASDARFQARRAHSEFIHHIPECQLHDVQNDTIDLDVEAKCKNLAIDKMRKDFQIHDVSLH